MESNEKRPLKSYAVTGTYHGSIVYAISEGEARRIFHARYNGESIIHMKEHKHYLYFD